MSVLLERQRRFRLSLGVFGTILLVSAVFFSASSDAGTSPWIALPLRTRFRILMHHPDAQRLGAPRPLPSPARFIGRASMILSVAAGRPSFPGLASAPEPAAMERACDIGRCAARLSEENSGPLNLNDVSSRLRPSFLQGPQPAHPGKRGQIIAWEYPLAHEKLPGKSLRCAAVTVTLPVCFAEVSQSSRRWEGHLRNGDQLRRGAARATHHRRRHRSGLGL